MRRVCLYAFCMWLAALSPAFASIIVNWLDEPITLFSGGMWSTQVPLDIDGSGVYDYVFGSDDSFLGLRSEGQNRYVIAPSPPPNIGGPIEPLYPDYEIGMSLADGLMWFGADHNHFSTLGVWLSSGSSGNFRGHHAYMGIEFIIDGNIHYGWINLLVAEDFAYGEIHGWAYASTSGMPIIAGAIPETSTLVLLLAGGLGLLSFNRHSRNVR